MLLLILALQDAAPMPEPDPTGLEWMTVASVLVPMVLLAVLIYLGRRNTV